MSLFPDLDVLKDIPGYQAILKAVLKSQIQVLVEQLSDQTGEESVLLTASVTDGTLCHLGSPSGKIFLDDHDEFKSQFLGFCLKRHHKRKANDIPERSLELSSDSSKRQKMSDITTVVTSPSLHPSSLQHIHPGRHVAGRRRPSSSYSEVHPVPFSESMSLTRPQLTAADIRNNTINPVAELGPGSGMNIKQEPSVANTDNAAGRLDTDHDPSGSDSRQGDESNIVVKQEVDEDDLEITGVELSTISQGSADNSQPGFDSGQWLHTAMSSTAAAYDTSSAAADQMSNGADNGSDYSNKSWTDDETDPADGRQPVDWMVMDADGGHIVNWDGLQVTNWDGLQVTEGQKGKKQLLENRYTVKKTVREVYLVTSFLQSKGETRELEVIEPSALDPLLAEFLLNVKKQNGDDYDPSTLRQIISSVDRHLKHRGYGQRIMTSYDNFTMTKKALKDRQDTMKMQGKCTSTRKVQSLTVEEIDILFDKGLLGTSSSHSVINTLWLYNTKYFGLRRCHEHYNMTWGDLELKQRPDGNEYLQYNAPSPRARFKMLGIVGNGPLRVFANKLQPDRCPVTIYKFYASKRPKTFLKKGDPFYLGICKPDSDAWFMQVQMGHKRLLSVFKSMLAKAGLNYKYVL